MTLSEFKDSLPPSTNPLFPGNPRKSSLTLTAMKHRTCLSLEAVVHDFCHYGKILYHNLGRMKTILAK